MKQALVLAVLIIQGFSTYAREHATCEAASRAKIMATYMVNENLPYFQLGDIGKNRFTQEELFKGKEITSLEVLFKEMDLTLMPIFIKINRSYADSTFRGLARAITYSDITRNTVHKNGAPFSLTEKFCAN